MRIAYSPISRLFSIEDEDGRVIETGYRTHDEAFQALEEMESEQ